MIASAPAIMVAVIPCPVPGGARAIKEFGLGQAGGLGPAGEGGMMPETVLVPGPVPEDRAPRPTEHDLSGQSSCRER